MGNIAIKEQDLHAITKELMDKALAIDRKNKEKICRFVSNLVENGGHKTKAALDAGYGGAEKDKDGKIRTDKERNHIACSEATQLLSNIGISDVYETLLAQRFMAKIFVKNLTKEHYIHILYQAGLKGLDTERNFKSGISAIIESGKLAGFYEIEEKDKDKVIKSYMEEHKHAANIFGQINEAAEVVAVNSRKRLN